MSREQANFPCPQCGARTLVANTRRTASGRWRRRDCSGGHRFTTLEVPADEARQDRSAQLREILQSAVALLEPATTAGASAAIRIYPSVSQDAAQATGEP